MNELYEIFSAYNAPWTSREVVCFVIIIAIAAVGLYGLLRCQRIVLPQAAGILLLLIFLFIVFGSTVFARMPKPYHDYELEVFWSWEHALNGNKEMLKEILLNCVLLVPAGVLLPVIVRKKLPWWKGLLIGVFISVAIELSQLFFCRGLFEWDDMIHNSLGCMLGCLMSGLVIGRKRTRRNLKR